MVLPAGQCSRSLGLFNKQNKGSRPAVTYVLGEEGRLRTDTVSKGRRAERAGWKAGLGEDQARAGLISKVKKRWGEVWEWA